MDSKFAALLATAALFTAGVAFVPTASADHNCALEDLTWTGLGERPINEGIRLADQACDGYHGHSCDGKYLDYGWYGRCI